MPSSSVPSASRAPKKSVLVLTYKNLGEGPSETAQWVRIPSTLHFEFKLQSLYGIKERTKLTSDLHMHTKHHGSHMHTE